jgi:hypothetical protein
MAETIDPYDLPSKTFSAWEAASDPERIKKAWADCGLFPFLPSVVLNSDKITISLPFKKPEPTSLVANVESSSRLPLPDVSPLHRRFSDLENFNSQDITMDFVMSREFRPFLDHFIQINESVILPHVRNYVSDIMAAGPAATAAPLFDDPLGPTAPQIVIPLIGSKSSDILNSNNPVLSPHATGSKKRKRGLSLPHGGLLTSDAIVDQFVLQEQGPFSLDSSVSFQIILLFYSL